MEALYTGIGWGVALLGAGMGAGAFFAGIGLATKWSNGN